IDKISLPKNGNIQSGDVLAHFQTKTTRAMPVQRLNSRALNLAPLKSRLATIQTRGKELDSKTTIKRSHIFAEAAANKSTFAVPDNDLTSQLQKTGVYAPPLDISPLNTFNSNEIHIIDNRAGCAAKLYADLKRAKCTVRILYVNEDASTPIIANALPDEIIRVDSYNDHNSVLNALRDQAKAHSDKEIYLHPGWGFLSEDYGFVSKVEKLKSEENLKVKFVGPPSHAMELAGDKLEFRKLVDEVCKKKQITKKFNPPYSANPSYPAKDLLAYITGNFYENHPLDFHYRQLFNEIKTKMNGDVAIKAVAGGGGKGIEFFKIDPTLADEDNYRNYVQACYRNSDYAEKHYSGNGKMLTEQFVRGVTRHLE
ncbi:MAG TPA: biotin carboxylase N-terminal domain-containing protein, partial [Gammaproteobacteria bacterium]|nr:biotin carboxylase N-terminal domain-containing protein [Gammaproteobacteria bacterium]